jgi:hypothetical protein
VPFRLASEITKILSGVRLVAFEAAFQVRLVVDFLVRAERLIFPFSVTQLVGIFRAPAGALFHHRIGDKVAFDETALGILRRLACGVELRLVLHQGEDGAARNRLAFPRRLDGGRCRPKLAILLVVVPVQRGVERSLGVVLRESNLVTAGESRESQHDSASRTRRGCRYGRLDVGHRYPPVFRGPQVSRR